MTREFTSVIEDDYKVSINFRSKKIRVWVKYHNKWCQHLISGVLTNFELLSVAYDMSYSDFKKFLQSDNFSIWN